MLVHQLCVVLGQHFRAWGVARDSLGAALCCAVPAGLWDGQDVDVFVDLCCVTA